MYMTIDWNLVSLFEIEQHNNILCGERMKFKNWSLIFYRKHATQNNEIGTGKKLYFEIKCLA